MENIELLCTDLLSSKSDCTRSTGLMGEPVCPKWVFSFIAQSYVRKTEHFIKVTIYPCVKCVEKCTNCAKMGRTGCIIIQQ